MISVALIAESPLIAAGLAEGLTKSGEFDVVLSSRTLAEARRAGFGGARLAIVNIGASEGDDFLGDGPAFLLLADAEAADDRIGEWLIDGCSVLPANASIEALTGASYAALAGLVATKPAMAAEALRYERTGAPPTVAGRDDRLTPREKQVLQEMSEGLNNREIAGALGISTHTAKFHVAQIIAKLEAQSRAHAVAKGLRAGLVEA